MNDSGTWEVSIVHPRRFKATLWLRGSPRRKKTVELVAWSAADAVVQAQVEHPDGVLVGLTPVASPSLMDC